MPTIDKLLEKMEQRNVQQIVIVNDQKMQLFSNGHAADGPHISLQQLQDLLNKSVPPSILARLKNGGQCRFPYPSPYGLFNITCERKNETFKVSIVAASPSKRPQTDSSTGLTIPSPVPASMPSLAPTGQGSAASANSQRWFGSAGAIGLLIAGALIGAAVIVPSFVSSSNPTSPKEIQSPTIPTPNVNAPTFSPNTPAPPVLHPTSPQTIESQAPGDALDEGIATPEEEEFFAGCIRAVEHGERALKVITDNSGDATARANARVDLGQAMIELNSLVMPERLVRVGMPGVVSLLRESNTEWRFCLSTLEEAMDDSGNVRDQAALDVAIKHAEKANNLHKAAQQKMLEVQEKLPR